jgi:DNA-binding beta-propeller fold protein YncE
MRETSSNIQHPTSREAPSSNFQSISKKGRWCLDVAVSLVFGCWILVLLAGCSTTPKSPPPTPIVWPSPPEAPRIAYVQSISRPADLGSKQSAFTRFGHWITGSDKGNELLVRPFGVALDEHDNLCLTDTGANRVCYFDGAKRKWESWDHIGRLRFSAPVAVARSQGTFYVADSGLASVLAFDQGGKLLLQITNHLDRPSGLAILGGQLFVADSRRHCLVVFDLRGNFQREFGRRGLAPGQFNFPTHLAVDAQGDLLVTDSMNSRVQVLDAQGAYKGEIGKIGDSPGHFSRPKGIAVDSAGHVYVMDGLFDNLQIFDQAGRLLLNLGEAGSGPGEFWLPNGIAIRRNGEILVADSYNRRVQVFKYIGP